MILSRVSRMSLRCGRATGKQRRFRTDRRGRPFAPKSNRFDLRHTSRRVPIFAGMSSFGLLAYGISSAFTEEVCSDEEVEVAEERSERAEGEDKRVLRMVSALQKQFVDKLQSLKLGDGSHRNDTFEVVSWKRGEDGEFGGGTRYQVSMGNVFNQASVNVSHVDYRTRPRYPIDSATALSVILHPGNPRVPSMHFHISYMQPREKKPYWRMIVDLNPALADPSDRDTFDNAIREVQNMSPRLYERAREFGRRYFYIPALERCRGISHYFIGKVDENVLNQEQTVELAESFAKIAIRTYVSIAQSALTRFPDASDSPVDLHAQVAYHTLYLFQVLTLDRGTTHGVLAHSDNDVGTLGSLPNFVDCDLLLQWGQMLPPPQTELVRKIVDAVVECDPAADGSGGICEVTDVSRARLANVLRSHYRTHRGATKLQAELDLNLWQRWMREDRDAMVSSSSRGV